MKKIEAIIAPFKFDEVKEALEEAGIRGMTFSEVREWDQHGGPVALYRGTAYVVEFRPKVKIEVMVENEEVKEVTDTIIGVLRTGHLGDGQVAILSAETVIRVHTGVREAEVMSQRNGSLGEGSRAVRPHNQGDRARAA
jgi:nitrogen regulatory protein P-II 1